MGTNSCSKENKSLKGPLLYVEEMGLLMLVSDHPSCSLLEELLREHLQRPGRLCTSVIALIEVVRLYKSLSTNENLPQIEKLHCFLSDNVEDLFEIIYSFEKRDFVRALGLQKRYHLDIVQSQHLALVQHHQVDMILGTPEAYGLGTFEMGEQFIPLPQ